MKEEEIKALMNRYTEAISYNVLEGIHSPEDDEKYEVSDDELAQEKFVAKKRDEAHKIAIEVLDKILTPELKVFIRNLCFNRLGYPDDPVFYKIFGDFPQVGDKISESALKKMGLNFDLSSYDLWAHEGNFITKEVIDGETYYVIEYLEESEEDNDEKIAKIKHREKAVKAKAEIKNLGIKLPDSVMEWLDEVRHSDAALIEFLHTNRFQNDNQSKKS